MGEGQGCASCAPASGVQGSVIPDDQIPCRREGANPDDWFAAPNSPRELKARKACMDCPLYWQCQEYALTEGIPHGTFGGMDEKTRARVWARTPGGKPTKFLDDIDAALSTNGVELREGQAA